MRRLLENPGSASIYPLTGVCDRCFRERVDLFQHPDGNRYCVDTFACEARYYIQGEDAAQGLLPQIMKREGQPSERRRGCVRYEIWFHDGLSWVSTDMSSRWRWLARLRAWEHTKRGWFVYEVRIS